MSAVSASPAGGPASGARRVVVGLSGGVDSAVSAWLLKEQGWDVVGLFMKNWEDDDDAEYCSTRQDWLDAASVADVIGIDIEAVNFAAEYRERVFADFLREYSAGRTPNPDVLCNAEIKFKAFLDHAMRMGASCIATGPDARVRRVANGGAEGGLRHELLRGLDVSKDQSYFLHRQNQAQLSRTLFPVGELHQTEVRRLALEIGLPNAKKKDSTGICFIGERPFREFLNRYLSHEPGPIVDERGHEIGRHVGLSFYTLGQRQGLGIGGLRSGGGTHAPWFVAAKDLDRNRLIAVQGHDHPALLSRHLHAEDASWVAGHPPAPGRLGAKTRYRQADAPCSFRLLAPSAGQAAPAPGSLEEHDRYEGQETQDGAGPGGPPGFSLEFIAPDPAQWAVTPGQSAVLYEGEVCLGGGVISQSWH